MMPSFDGLLFRLRTSERLELQTHPPPSTHTHDAARADTWYTSYRYCLYFLNKRYRICQTRGKIRELVLYYYYYGNAPSRTGVPMRFDSNPLLDLLARRHSGDDPLSACQTRSSLEMRTWPGSVHTVEACAGRSGQVGLGGASWLSPVAANRIGTCWKATSSFVTRKSTSTGPGSWPAAPGTSS